MRLIDEAYLQAHKVHGVIGNVEGDFVSGVTIAHAPTIDAVPVIRCKDCKHFSHDRMECENGAVSTDHEGGAQYSLNFYLDDYCSFGEPREVNDAAD